MQKTNESPDQSEKHTTADKNFQILFQSENKRFFVLQGSQIIMDMETNAWRIGKGGFILFHKWMEIRLYSAPEPRYIDTKSDELISMESDLCDFQIYNYDDYPCAQEKGAVNRTRGGSECFLK